MKKTGKRALAIKETDGQFYLHDARGGVAVGEPLHGPFPSRIAVETARFEAMRAAAIKPRNPPPLRHCPPALARSRIA